MPRLRFNRRQFSRRALLALRLGLIALTLWALYALANRFVAPQHLPWKPLNINAPLGLATKTQLLKVSLGSREACAAMMKRDADGSAFTRLEAKDGPKSCGWSVALQSTQLNGARFSPREIDTLCPMSAASYIWLGEVDASARAFLGSGLKRVHHFGTYSCRTIAGTNRLSEHAFANAWDVSGFELDDGRMISVLSDWNGTGQGAPMRAAFLRETRRSACKLFRVTLSPDYNAAHKDHLHLDMGPSGSCR